MNIDELYKKVIFYVKDFIESYSVETTLKVTEDWTSIYYEGSTRFRKLFVRKYIDVFGKTGVIVQPGCNNPGNIIIPLGVTPFIETSLHYNDSIMSILTEPYSNSEFVIRLCHYLAARMYQDNMCCTKICDLKPTNDNNFKIQTNNINAVYEKENTNMDMFIEKTVFNPDYWHVGDAIEFTRMAKKGASKEPCFLTRAALIEKVGYTTIEVEYVDGIRVGMTITLDDVNTGKVKIRKLS